MGCDGFEQPLLVGSLLSHRCRRRPTAEASDIQGATAGEAQQCTQGLLLLLLLLLLRRVLRCLRDPVDLLRGLLQLLHWDLRL